MEEKYIVLPNGPELHETEIVRHLSPESQPYARRQLEQLRALGIGTSRNGFVTVKFGSENLDDLIPRLARLSPGGRNLGAYLLENTIQIGRTSIRIDYKSLSEVSGLSVADVRTAISEIHKSNIAVLDFEWP